MNVLAIGAHFDDLELGCGGTLARHCRKGDKVIGFVATDSGFSNREGVWLRKNEAALQEAMTASKIIGYDLMLGEIPTFYLEYGEQIHCKLLKLIEENHIDLIYTHWVHDVHHDHRNLALATLHTARHVNRILMYRSNWYVSEKEFCENFLLILQKRGQSRKRPSGHISPKWRGRRMHGLLILSRRLSIMD